MYTVIIGDTKN